MGRVGVSSHLRFSLDSSVFVVSLSQILSLIDGFLLLSFDSWTVNLMRSFEQSVLSLALKAALPQRSNLSSLLFQLRSSSCMTASRISNHECTSALKLPLL